MTLQTHAVPRMTTRSPSRGLAILGALVALLAVLLLAMPVSSSEAAEKEAPEVSWSVQPSTPDGPDGRDAFTFKVDAGTTLSDWVAVNNFSDHKITLRVYAADATTDYDTGEFTLIGADQASTDVGAWTSVAKGSTICPDSNDEAEAACAAKLGTGITLEARSTANVPFTITVPHDATPGDHAAGIVASYASQANDATGAQVRVEQRTGTRIYLRVNGELAPSLRVTGTVAGYDGTVNPVGSGDARVDFDVTNSGNVRLDAVSRVHLTGLFGKDLGAVDLPALEHLLPGGTAHVTAELPGVAPWLLLSAEVTVTPAAPAGEPADGLGTLTPVGSSARAWAVPWSLLGLVALIGGMTALVVTLRRRSRRLLAAELADYEERVRAQARDEALAATGHHATTGHGTSTDAESENR